MKNVFLKKFWPGIAWFFVVMTLVCIPGSDLPKVDAWYTKIHLDKWVHAGLFGILAFLWFWPIANAKTSKIAKNTWIIAIIFITCAWGLATEFIQKYFIPNRDFDWWDWVADSAGILLAWIVINRKL